MVVRAVNVLDGQSEAGTHGSVNSTASLYETMIAAVNTTTLRSKHYASRK